MVLNPWINPWIMILNPRINPWVLIVFIQVIRECSDEKAKTLPIIIVKSIKTGLVPEKW